MIAYTPNRPQAPPFRLASFVETVHLTLVGSGLPFMWTISATGSSVSRRCVLFNRGLATGAYRFDICASMKDGVAENTFGVVEKTVPSARCAALRHVGSDDALETAAKYLYSVWLPSSGEELRDFPLYLRRLRFFTDVPEHAAETDVFCLFYVVQTRGSDGFSDERRLSGVLRRGRCTGCPPAGMGALSHARGRANRTLRTIPASSRRRRAVGR